MLDQVIAIDEFNAKATARKLTYLFESGLMDQLRKSLKLIKLQPSCFDDFVRQTANKLEKQLEVQVKKDKEMTQKMFSQPLYDDKPEPVKEVELTAEEIERAEETEYLGTLSNFHWVMYPFFKSVERVCDKIFGCKRKALKVNEELRKKRDE